MLYWFTLFFLAVTPNSKETPTAQLLSSTQQWQVGSVSTYDQAQIWDAINGAADQYLEFGFVSLQIAEFTREQTRVKAEVYHMKSALAAFGIFAAQRFGDSKRLGLGDGSYSTSTHVFFHKAHYYVKLSGNPSGNVEHTQALANTLATRILTSSKPPAIFGLFPVQHRIEDSQSYIPRAALGISGADKAFAVNYMVQGKEAKIAILQRSTEAQTKQLAEKISTALKRRATSSKQNVDTRTKTLFYNFSDKYRGEILLSVRGRFLVLVKGGSKSWAKDQAGVLLHRSTQMEKE